MDEKENQDPLPSKKRRLSLSRLKGGRFKNVTMDEVKLLEKQKIPKTTAASTKWALNIFTDWLEDHNKRNEDDIVPVVTPSCSKEDLNKWLPVFIAEVRSQQGEAYPPRTIYSILSGILRFMCSENTEYPNFLDKSDPVFSVFRTALDNVFRCLRSDGVGARSSHTEGISMEEENKLWDAGVIVNTDTPLGLLRAVFFFRL